MRVMLAITDNDETGWDGYSTLSNLNAMLIHNSSIFSPLYPKTLASVETHGSLIKHLKFYLGCCYNSEAAIKITQISPNFQGGTKFIQGHSTVQRSRNHVHRAHGDVCGVSNSARTSEGNAHVWSNAWSGRASMSQSSIEDVFQQVVADFRFCIAREVLDGVSCT